MPPKKAGGSDPDAPMALTDGDLRLIKAVFDNMTQKPDADWDCVAAALGLKDAKCAKERFRQMSVRHGWRDQGSSGAPSPSKRGAASAPSQEAKVTKRRATGRKTGKRGAVNDEAIEGENESSNEDEI